MSKNKAYYEDLFVKHLLEVGVENWCETYERGNYYYCFWLKNGEQRYWTNMSEEHLEEIKENIMENNLKKQDQQIDQLKQQLDEKDTRIAELEDKDWYEACIKQLEEQNNRLIDTLKEKDKEIERLKQITIFKDSRNMTTKINGVDFSDEQIIILQNLDVLKKHDQTQLAIQELEKLKEDCFNQKELVDFGNFACFMVDIADILEIINNQIKELKGEKNGTRN